MNGDIMIKLTCDHFAHKSCLSLMFDTDDRTKLPVCGVCQQVTRCMDDNLHDHMVEELEDNMISLPPFAVI
ncbi:uncharacterized protein SPAPADRAFT_63441 [Spathaspora passalidarum NRRL Y-27907]|uniref:Uncharacterized protein n=1 Tax=Spathaspora passalidarum (strain NRRL Y-27907 / 11-Y1) TaxID=619300 RepID=G3AUP5_SPAPN|nr:uncharacterized protein SPAPADRAFT_63441 [Spathaspora passalidarum NRRL Y-27907]EGW30601.1 hypothetical protein SPAPADRAFT_63441 [Spathaspora passalidarum NRRL Y-27907]